MGAREIKEQEKVWINNHTDAQQQDHYILYPLTHIV